MDLLDSASLRHGDCFGLPMQELGRYSYAILPAFGRHLAFDYPFEIEVSPAGSPDQLDIAVGFRDGRFTATPAEARIRPGTMVCWSAEDGSVPGFMIAARGGRFASDPLSGPSLYSHRFGHEGVYAWIDRHSGAVSGKVIVASSDSCDQRALDKWNKQVQQAIVISIPDAAKAEHRAAIGQAVIFVIDDAAGISITDERCAEMDHCRPKTRPPVKTASAGKRKP